MNDWIARHTAAIAERAEGEIQRLVAISSPSGDVAGAEACFAECAPLIPDAATIERPACSSPDHAPDWVARLPGTRADGPRILLLGHVDTVVAHAKHRPVEVTDEHLIGSGTVDMKGGDVLALGVLRALVDRRAEFAEAACLLVCDEEWRTDDFHHGPAFADFDACLCFEAGESRPGGLEGVVVKRKAAATLHIVATGRAAHSGSAPDKGLNALLALAKVAQLVAAHHDPEGEYRRSAVPTILNAGDAFNVVPGAGELWCDVRADDLVAIDPVLADIPADLDGVKIVPTLARKWPGMDHLERSKPLLEAASATLGRTIFGAQRGGASDASWMAAAGIETVIDGLGPRGGAAHHPDEFVLRSAIPQRAAVALAITDAVLARGA